ncbi:MAG: hypothetical protein EOP38_07355 [Rubrivivax sp.]|nr:MAG: hypothetical protein EOP38_07355 [Rubrivivax sp.]
MHHDEHLPLSVRIERAEQTVRESDARLRHSVAHLRSNFGKGVRGQITRRLKSWAGIGLGLAAAGATTWALWPRQRRRVHGLAAGPQRPRRQSFAKTLIPMLPLVMSALSRSGFVPPSVMNWVSLVSSLVAARGAPPR